jgi:hypothetical protein
VFILGRMSFQVPGNMLITGCMMTFYKSTPAVIFWQVANQSFNSLVNYSNRNASGVSFIANLLLNWCLLLPISYSIGVFYSQLFSYSHLLSPTRQRLSGRHQRAARHRLRGGHHRLCPHRRR